MNNAVMLQEAFRQFEMLEEDVLPLTNSPEDAEEIKDYIDTGDALDMLDVIDTEAETEEDLEDSYVGKVIINCCVCHSNIFKDAKEIVVSEDNDKVNVGEECPYCFSSDGFTVIGEVAPYEAEPVYDVEVEPKEDETEIDVEETEDEDDDLEESWTDKEADDEISTCKYSEQDKKSVKKKKNSKQTNEALENIDVETEHDKIHIEAEEKVDSDDEMIVPPSDETVDTIEAEETPEEGEEDEEVEFDIDDFDEESFDGLGESYLTRVYENVNSFKTTSVKEDNNKLVIEGLINFKSGNSKSTTFVFESVSATKNGDKLKFKGGNTNITRGKKAFTLTGRLNNNKLVTESLNYNYKQKDSEGKSVRVYGTVKR